MSILSIQKWQLTRYGLFPRLLPGMLVLLTACGSMEFDTQATQTDGLSADIAPPSFTRGLIARRIAEPLYPLRAKALGIEGWVMLRFSVDQNGAVIGNTIETLDEQPPGYFETSSITAARRMTFENTRGQTVEDIRYVFRYELEEVNRLLTEAPSDEIQFRELIPTRFITPNYPSVAEELAIEGYVIVSFTVTETGVVEDVVITESEPPGVFNSEAITAAMRLRFEPRLVFDAPVRVQNVQYRFDWNLPR